MVEACLAIGSNLGDRASHMAAAVEGLRRTPGVELLAVSRAHETAPVGGPPGQGAFLNGACLVRTSLTARALLNAMQAIEHTRGRDREQETRWGPRTLDLDLLLFGTQIIDEPGLTVPHPRLPERLFVLEPLCEVAPDTVVPGVGVTVRALLARARAAGVAS